MASLKKRLEMLKDLGLIQASRLNQQTGVVHQSGVDQQTGAIPLDSFDARLAGPEWSEWKKAGRNCYTRSVLSSFSIEEAFAREIDMRMFGKIPAAMLNSVLTSAAPPDGVRLEEMTFFDLETTGLSGGSGTIAFLAGVGYFDNGNFVVDQVFIDDFPGESDFLPIVLRYFEQRPVVVSYNGAAFDVPLLRSRCVMNGLRMPYFRNLDLLYSARRLWGRTMESCALQVLETEILDIERENDVPSALIPQIWLDFVRRERNLHIDREYMESTDSRIRSVMAHNAQDIVSLAKLLCRVVSMVEFSEHIDHADIVGLSRMLFSAGRVDAAIDLLEQAGGEGDEHALVALARYYRRGHYGGGSSRCGTGGGGYYDGERHFSGVDGRYFERYKSAISRLNCSTFDSCIEKAKYLEHVEKNYDAALEASEKAMAILDAQPSPVTPRAKSALLRKRALVEKRISRLSRLLKKKQSNIIYG
jgi:uncharacterized protein YprB with RNaseH-like and TPR domain